MQLECNLGTKYPVIHVFAALMGAAVSVVRGIRVSAVVFTHTGN